MIFFITTCFTYCLWTVNQYRSSCIQHACGDVNTDHISSRFPPFCCQSYPSLIYVDPRLQSSTIPSAPWTCCVFPWKVKFIFQTIVTDPPPLWGVPSISVLSLGMNTYSIHPLWLANGNLLQVFRLQHSFLLNQPLLWELQYRISSSSLYVLWFKHMITFRASLYGHMDDLIHDHQLTLLHLCVIQVHLFSRWFYDLWPDHLPWRWFVDFHKKSVSTSGIRSHPWMFHSRL